MPGAPPGPPSAATSWKTERLVGAWGLGPFDNDDAADFAAEFEALDDSEGLEALIAALGAVGGEYIAVDEGARAVAAAEVLAAIVGLAGPTTSYNETAMAWIERTSPPSNAALVDFALAALERVMGEASELAELWDDAGEPWAESVSELSARLRAGRPAT